MTTQSLVLTADHGAVRVLTLNRPCARNALSRGLIRAAYTTFCAGVDLKEIYPTGAAAVIDPALAAEQTIAFAQHRGFGGLGDQFRAVSESNKQQIERPE